MSQRVRIAHLLLIVGICLCAQPLIATASDSPSEFTDEQAIEAGRDSLADRQRVPWYDKEKDDFRRIVVTPAKAPAAARESKQKVKKTSNWNWTWPWRWSWLDVFGALLQGIAWLIVIAVLAAGIYLIYKSLDVESFVPDTRDLGDNEETTDAMRIENLPVRVRSPNADFLAEARRLYEAGDYGEAIIYLFSYQLIQLDRNQWIRLTKGKTNRQYLREFRHKQVLRGLVAKSMITFEDFFFGQHPIGRQRFEDCWNRMDEFHELVKSEAS